MKVKVKVRLRVSVGNRVNVKPRFMINLLKDPLPGCEGELPHIDLVRRQIVNATEFHTAQNVTTPEAYKSLLIDQYQPAVYATLTEFLDKACAK